MSRLLSFLIGLDGASNRWCLVTFVELSLFLGALLVVTWFPERRTNHLTLGRKQPLAAERRVLKTAKWGQLRHALGWPETGVDLSSIGSGCFLRRFEVRLRKADQRTGANRMPTVVSGSLPRRLRTVRRAVRIRVLDWVYPNTCNSG